MDFDVVIVGGGIVGLATANALSRTQMNIAVIDANANLYHAMNEHDLMIRASAINLASQRYFEQLDIWHDLKASGRVLGFNSIDVTEKAGIAKLDADNFSYQSDDLGYIIENQLIQNTLFQSLQTHLNVKFFNHKVEDIFSSSDRQFLTLANGEKIAAKLLIGADGANSFVRKQQNIKLLQYPYRHQAIITTVKTERAHEACARQIFYPDGIIAFLPLWQPNMSCLVWSAKPEFATELASKETAEFNQSLTDITEKCLGECHAVNDRLVIPLIARYCPKPVKERVVLIGDAAHTIHPLAGQGVNLGLKDSKQLADIIIQRYSAGKDIGSKAGFFHYQRIRHQDNLTMLSAMHIIQETFNGEGLLKKSIRGIGMNIINASPLIKGRIIKYALGL